MTVTIQQGLATITALLTALTAFLILSLNSPLPQSLSPQFPISSITAHLTPVKAIGPNGETFWITASPAGPTYMVTVEADQSSPPIVNVSIVLEMKSSWVGWGGVNETQSRFWYSTLDFPQVNESNPLFPGESASQNVTFIGGVSAGDEVRVSGLLSDGQTFNWETTLSWQH
jgi:hypothetical protein